VHIHVAIIGKLLEPLYKGLFAFALNGDKESRSNNSHGVKLANVWHAPKLSC
jgi:hypothetical protein